MKDFFKEILIETFKDGDWFIGVIGWIITLMISGLLFFFGFYLVDSTYLPIKTSDGVVYEKYINPAHTTTIFVQLGKVMVPVVTYHPETYNLKVEIKSKNTSTEVNSNRYNTVTVGDTLRFDYVEGRISGEFYIKKVYYKDEG